MLDVRKLHMLAELDRLGTVAAVARSLRLTAPGISMQLAALEREVGLPLTERQGRRVALTPAGRVLAKHGRDIVDMITVAEMDTVALRDGATGSYRVAAYPSAAASILAQAWSTLVETQSGVSLHCVEMEPRDAISAVAGGEVDIAITHSYSNIPHQDTPGQVSTCIAVESVDLAVPTRQAGPGRHDDPVDLDQYAHHNWVVPHREWTCHEMVERACGVAGFQPRAVAEATDFSVQLALVAAGIGVALIPQLASTHLPPGVTLRRLSAPVHRYVFLATRQSSRGDNGLRRVQELLTTAAEEILPRVNHTLL